MGNISSCLKSVEVIALEDAQKYIIPLVIDEIRSQIIPDIINALQMTEAKLDEIVKQENEKQTEINII